MLSIWRLRRTEGCRRRWLRRHWRSGHLQRRHQLRSHLLADFHYRSPLRGEPLSERRAAVRLRAETADTLGIPGINGIPWTSGPPEINLNNFGDPFIGFSASLPWIRAETNVLFTNIWTKTEGQSHHEVRRRLARGSATTCFRRKPTILEGKSNSVSIRPPFREPTPASTTPSPASFSTPHSMKAAIIPSFSRPIALGSFSHSCRTNGWSLRSLHGRYWVALGVLSGRVRRRIAPASRNTIRRRTHSLSEASGMFPRTWHQYQLPRLRSPLGHSLPMERQNRDPHRIWHQLFAVPGQYLRLQLSGKAEQLLYRQLHALCGRSAERAAGNVSGRLSAFQQAVIPPTASSRMPTSTRATSLSIPTSKSPTSNPGISPSSAPCLRTSRSTWPTSAIMAWISPRNPT